ncbi:hypothetical protein [Aminivibrio sp.]
MNFRTKRNPVSKRGTFSAESIFPVAIVCMGLFTTMLHTYFH